MGRLDGRVALVTGASRGLGEAIAALFAAEGAKVVCAARTLNEGDHRLEGSLARTVERIREAGGEATAVQADLSQADDCLRLADQAARAFEQPVDVLVNNAVLTYFMRVLDYPLERWQRAFFVNVHAPFLLSRTLLPSMIERGEGWIVNISSGAAIGPGRGPYEPGSGRGRVEYGATKAALERFTQGLAQEVYEDGIAVSAVSPSVVVPTPGTVLHGVVLGEYEPAEYMAKAALLLASEPPERIAGRVCYSQQLLHEFGWLEQAHGRGAEIRGSGYSEI
jgi:NAD(P)-dependent dehydrogenase (short-subunit alcohol dehydrogenase family)